MNQANSIPSRPSVLSNKQFARRWRGCNNRTDSPPLDEDEEEAWRTRSLELLSSAHTLGGMLDLSFEVVESNLGVLSSLSSWQAYRLTCGLQGFCVPIRVQCIQVALGNYFCRLQSFRRHSIKAPYHASDKRESSRILFSRRRRRSPTRRSREGKPIPTSVCTASRF